MRTLSRLTLLQAVDGVAMGVKDLGMGVFKGVTGLVYDPFKGAKEAGGIKATTKLREIFKRFDKQFR